MGEALLNFRPLDPARPFVTLLAAIYLARGFETNVVPRYVIREGVEGWTVIDTWLNDPAIADGQALTDLPLARAEILASLLNWRISDHGGEQAE